MVEVIIIREVGGKRKGSGRKHIEDKKIQCYVFIKGSVIEKLGGKLQVQKIMLEAINKSYLDLPSTDTISPD